MPRGGSERRVDDELVLRLTLAEGKSLREAAVAAGCSPKHISRVLRRNKVPPRTVVRPYTEEELAFAKMLLEDGAPYTEVARTIGRDDEHLARLFPGYGVHSPAEALAVARMFRDFERLLERRGLSDRSSIPQ